MRNKLYIVLLFLFSANCIAQEYAKTVELNLSNGLSQNTITSITEDAFGQIWFGTSEKLQYYTGTKLGTIEEVNNRVLTIYSSDSAIYCTTVAALHKIDIYSLKVKSTFFEEKDFYSCYKLLDVFLLVNSNKQDTLFYDFDLKKRSKLKMDSSLPNLEEGYNLKMGDFSIWGNKNGVFISNKNQDTICISRTYTTEACKIGNQAFVASNDGLLKISIVKDTFNVDILFPKKSFESVFIDRNDNLWLGTSRSGLFMIHKNTYQSSYYPLKNKQEEPIAAWCCFKYKEKLFTGTSNGIIPLEQTGETEKQLIDLTEKYTINTAIPTADFLLFGTSKNGIIKFENNSLVSVYKNEFEVLDNTVLQITENKDGFIALTKKNFIQLDTNGNFLFKKLYDQSTSTYYGMSLEIETEGYRVASTNGIDYFDHNLNLNNRIYSPDAQVYSMSTKYKNEIWVASLDGGLFKANNGNLIPFDFTDNHLLSLNVKDSTLWIGSSTGIYALKNSIPRPFSKTNGFPIIEYNQGAVFYDKPNNKLNYVGVGGVFSFETDQVLQTPKIPQLLVRLDNQIVTSEEEVILDFETATINFNLSPILFSDKNLFSFYYKINSDDWSSINTDENVFFNAPYGLSYFQVKIENWKGEQVYKERYKIERDYPFWTTIGFKIAMLIIILLFLFGIYVLIQFIRTKKALKRQQLEQEISTERLRISGELHDNIGARLTHIISSLDIEIHNRKEGLGNMESINQFARETMTQLRETIWAVSDQTLFFSEFIARTKQYINEVNLMCNEEVRIEINYPKDFEMLPAEVINYYRIIQEGINNAIKYAECKTIVVRIAEEDNMMIISIADDGKGFEVEAIKFGNGLANMKRRTDELNVSLNIVSILNQGTTITVKFSHVK